MNTTQASYSFRDFFEEASYISVGLVSTCGFEDNDLFRDQAEPKCSIITRRILSYIPIVSAVMGTYTLYKGCVLLINSAPLVSDFQIKERNYRIFLVIVISGIFFHIVRGLLEIMGLGILILTSDIRYNASDVEKLVDSANDFLTDMREKKHCVSDCS